MPSGYKADAFGAIAAALSGESFAFRAPTIGIVFRIIDTRLVEINPSVGLEFR